MASICCKRFGTALDDVVRCINLYGGSDDRPWDGRADGPIYIQVALMVSIIRNARVETARNQAKPVVKS